VPKIRQRPEHLKTFGRGDRDKMFSRRRYQVREREGQLEEEGKKERDTARGRSGKFRNNREVSSRKREWEKAVRGFLSDGRNWKLQDDLSRFVLASSECQIEKIRKYEEPRRGELIEKKKIHADRDDRNFTR